MTAKSPRLRRIEAPVRLFQLLSTGEVGPAAAAALTRVLWTRKDQALIDVALVRSGLSSRTTVSRLMAPLRDPKFGLLRQVHVSRQRGYGYRTGSQFVHVLDAFELPPVERLLLMVMQVSGHVLSAKVWAAKTFPAASHAAQCVPNALHRLTSLGLVENPQGWAWRAAGDLQATEPDVEPIDVLEEVDETARLRPLKPAEIDEMATRPNPLLSQAIQQSQMAQPAPVAADMRLSECLAAHRAHLAAGGPLSADLPDDALAKILVGAAVDLVASTRCQRIARIEPDVVAGALQVVAWERRLVVDGEGRDRTCDGHWNPLVRAGGMHNLPQALLTALYAAFGQENRWRRFLSLREIFTPGLGGGWDRIVVEALGRAHAENERMRALHAKRGKDMPVPATFDECWLPRQVHRLHCEQARIEFRDIGLKILVGHAESDRTRAYALADGRAPEPAADALVGGTRPHIETPPAPPSAKLFEPRELELAKVAVYRAWNGAGSLGPSALLALLSGSRHDGGPQGPAGVERDVCFYLQELRQRWATLQQNHGAALAMLSAQGAVADFDSLWAPLAAAAPENPEVESLIGKSVAEIRFADLLAVRLPEDGGVGPLVEWGALVRRKECTKQDIVRLRETRVAAWLERSVSQEAACG